MSTPPSNNSAQESAGRNRLSGEVSPYLLLHQGNPVDWYPWGEEALQRARQENKPIFLSVGYSTCYWCHVMERESFSDPAIAALMNEHFVNIKLDREERPDLDEIYMAATQLLTQQGGWPNSVFLTPGLMPYFAGTYFPPVGRQGLPSFRQVLESMANAWHNRRDDVQTQASELEDAMRRFLEERGAPAENPPSAEAAERSLTGLAERFDATWGGFGEAPKFPSPGNLYLLEAFAAEQPDAARMLDATLDQMARGGLYDQLAGGFHRYATDREWKVPHFEKMLYDNGLLLELYARRYQATGNEGLGRAAHATAEFLEREMSAPEGGFWSAIDAETDGREGAYYVWTLDELEQALGAEDATYLAPLYGFDRAPFFEESAYVLHLPLPLAEQAQRRRMTVTELLEQIEPLRAELLAARSERQRPPTDDKILSDWNGMAITGLAVCGQALGEDAFIGRAAQAADFVWHQLRPEGVLHHAWRAGQAKNPAYLSDYAYLVRGFLTLHEATGEEPWLDRAQILTREQTERLGDPRGGFFVAGEQPDVLFRSREVFDGALPSANAIAALNLLELARRTDDSVWLEQAERLLQAFGGIIEQRPDGARMLSLAARLYRQQSKASNPESAATAETASDALQDEARHVVATKLSRGAVTDDGWQPFRVEIEIAEGWHLYANDPGDATLTPTALAGDGAELRSVEYPPGEPVEGARIYAGLVVLAGECRAATEETPQLTLRYQPCDAVRCLPPVEVELA
ncbi:MAG: DUF255 domain-containing protein [Acidobacteriota bacterium]